MFRWTCLSIAALFGIAVIWILLDLKTDVARSLGSAESAVAKAQVALDSVNGELPNIVSEVKKGTETLSGLADDVKLLKSVAGIDEKQRSVRGLAEYADAVQQTLAELTAEKQARIEIEAVIGSQLKDVESAEEFLVGLNREMIVILAVAKSKQEVLWRISHSAPPRRKPYFVKFPESEPIELETLLRRHHPESADLPEYK